KWTESLNFKKQQLGRHFKKHKDDFPIKNLGINTQASYIEKARENIFNSIFQKGFIIRLGLGDRVAFFTQEDNGYPKFIVSLCIHNEITPKLSTFYSANGKTSHLTIKNFINLVPSNRTYQKDCYTSFIAHFNHGKSDGWKIIRTSDYQRDCYEEGEPTDSLHKAINFLDLLGDG
ncbi:MAG: hypothetical protein AAGG81_00835, partial [Chlamydiota bacterium]